MLRLKKANPQTFWQKMLGWLVLTLIWGLTIGAVAIWNLPAFYDWQLANSRFANLQSTLDQEKKTVARLESEKEALASDSKALERATREEYLLLRPGEEVYIFDNFPVRR